MKMRMEAAYYWIKIYCKGDSNAKRVHYFNFGGNNIFFMQ